MQKMIAIVAYEGAQMSAVLGLGDLFEIANRGSARLGGGTIGVAQIGPQAPVSAAYDAIIIPPNLSGKRGQGDAETQEFIRAQHKAGALICSACAGAFWLGYAGILDGRNVTTHWALEDEFRQKFPQANVQAEHLLIDDNDIVTAGGVMAWIDLGLFLVERWLGAEILTATCRHLLVDPRGREQRNYRSFRPVLVHGDSTVLQVQHWMEGAVNGDLSVRALAQRAGQSERTFLRKFKAATGMSPNAYVQQLRVEKARGILERTQEPIAQIAWAVGYRDISAFGRVFRDITGVNPGEYRARFGV